MAKKTNSNRVEYSKEVIGALADAFGKDFITIKRWIAQNDDRLTSEKAKEVFRRKNIVQLDAA